MRTTLIRALLTAVLIGSGPLGATTAVAGPTSSADDVAVAHILA